MNAHVKLITNEGLSIEIEKEIAMKISLIQQCVETGVTEIPLPGVKFEVLKKIVQYCEMHKYDNPPKIEKPLRSTNMIDLVGQQDADFIDVINFEELNDIILAANYLDIQSLLDLSCTKVATLIKDKTPEEIRKTFNIQNELTQEEEQQIREETKWAEDDS